MKNLKIGKRLSICFIIVVLLFITTSAASVKNIFSVAGNLSSFYNGPYQVVTTTLEMRRAIQSAEKNILWSCTTNDLSKSNEYIAQAESDLDTLKDSTTILQEEYLGDKSDIDKFLTIMTSTIEIREEVLNLGKSNKSAEALVLYNSSYAPKLAEARAQLDSIGKVSQENATKFYDAGQKTQNTAIMMVIGLSIIIIIIVIIICINVTKGLTKPIKEIEMAAKKLSNGELDIKIEYEAKDELGLLAENMTSLANSLNIVVGDIVYLLGQMAEGNMNLKIEKSYRGSFEPISTSLKKIIGSLNYTLEQINESADQVASGSDQVAGGAQGLSQGATEQASSIEELSATIVEIAEQVKNSALYAEEATANVKSVSTEITESNEQMQRMILAMSEISSKSNEIGKIIKTIEDIAFQTNILALNAAVEAARAGSAGKGFAVVADEVRNLASKSAEAAKNTTALIEGTILAVEKGTSIADDTAKSLTLVVDGATAVSEKVVQISRASTEQASAINQVTMGVEQISSVIQNNSATAEESAAASEELSGQAQLLKSLISKFKLNNSVSEISANFKQEHSETSNNLNINDTNNKY